MMTEEFINTLKQYGILNGKKLNTKKVTRYVSYQKSEEDGVWLESEQYPEQYFIPLGYDI